ncbi:MAG: hypothetical protein JWL98_1825 [Xanthomonadaceae bacterium]|nr:hypothetical protein [Xanthomonadaceae bacterium]
MKLGLLATGLGLVMNASNARAAVVTHEFDGNSVNYCQAFTPGPSNTIRNRVLGAENVGSATINVACDWHSMYNGTGSDPSDLYVYFSNNNASGTISVSCSLLTGYQTQGGANQYLVTKTFDVVAGTQSQLHFSGADNPDPAGPSATFNNDLIGINCSLPHGGVINDTYLVWSMDNGV